jgi:hypothetical protein
MYSHVLYFYIQDQIIILIFKNEIHEFWNYALCLNL